MCMLILCLVLAWLFVYLFPRCIVWVAVVLMCLPMFVFLLWQRSDAETARLSRLHAVIDARHGIQPPERARLDAERARAGLPPYWSVHQ